uniref:uncharacterized protein LOC101242471 isoform X3 n=1 Tax=Ciona intestinalis TaxID=7719 RepID=UPI000EF4EA88|nr:uncharacterized protein LOC101242471 isoform X3 [Ciona intestinalis]|eukprot:XP_026693194.1 uncharacterized protein LOC101242471 isoform X3 [Ciona intestinalis]
MAGWGNLDARESRCEVTSRRQKLLVRNTIQPFMNKDVCSIVWLVVGIHYERESRSRSNVTTREAMSFMNEDRRSKMTICKDNVLGYQGFIFVNVPVNVRRERLHVLCYRRKNEDAKDRRPKMPKSSKMTKDAKNAKERARVFHGRDGVRHSQGMRSKYQELNQFKIQYSFQLGSIAFRPFYFVGDLEETLS